MENRRIATAWIALAAGAVPILASSPNVTAAPTQMVITVRSEQTVNAADLTALQGNTVKPVVSVERLAGNLADLQLFVLLDDSTRSTSLGVQLPELKRFLKSLPSTTEVAVGYMRNGTFGLAQAFTSDHAKAAAALRLPASIPGENGNPYFALSDLAKHWPSKQFTHRRAVLMLTDGVDRYYSAAMMDDPYVDAAIHDALKQGVMVYSIYLRGAGVYGWNDWVTNLGQSRLIQVSEETGGDAYFQGFSDPVSIAPFLKDLEERLANQYNVTIEAFNGKGVQRIQLRSDLPSLKIEAPTRIYVR